MITKKTKKTKKTPAGTKVTKEFTIKLTREEKELKSDGAAALNNEIKELELQFKELKDNWKAKIDSRTAHMQDLLSVVHAKEEKRTVECTLVKDYEAREIQYWYNGDILEKRTMTESELQVEMTLGSKKRGTKQRLQDTTQNLSSMPNINGVDSDVSEVIKEETSKRTKLSAVDWQ